MIDTNTVNFAMKKVETILTPALDLIKTTSPQYVKYIVTQTIVFNIAALILTLIGFIGLFKFYKLGKENNTFDEAQTVIPLFIFGCVALFSSIALVCCLMDTTLALTNPEMFTVQQLINDLGDK